MARIFLGAAGTAALLCLCTATPTASQPSWRYRAPEPSAPSQPGGARRPVEMAPGVLTEINFVRTHPAAYAEQLRRERPTAATEEAIAVLERREPAPALRFSPDLGASAAAHALDQDEHDSFEHAGSDGSSAGERMRRRGVYAGLMAEAMSAGEATAGDVVRQLIVDEGVPARGHRKDLLDPFLRLAGVGCAPHPTYRVICVIDLASNPPPRD
ncbi:MAG TPA: CAP domain-containing protein [Caulobacteraceae bacterium]